MKHHKHMGFNRLASKVAREYEEKGVPTAEAKLWGKETAAKVFHEQHHPPLHHQIKHVRSRFYG